MNEKGARIACPTGEEVVIPTGIKEIYVRVLQNRLSIIVVKCISADGKAIPLLVIIPGVIIIETWFHEKITGHEFVIVSPNSYTNESICMLWLDYFIKYNNYGPDKE
jgi:hypothetical protein